MTPQDIQILIRIIAAVVFIFTVCSLPALADHYGWKNSFPRFNFLGRTYLGLFLFSAVFWAFVILLIS